MRIVLTGIDCPFLPDVTVGVQRRRAVVREQLADGRALTWLLEADVSTDRDMRGPYVQGRPGSRFVYLSWQCSGSGMISRAKLMLDAVPAEVLDTAQQTGLRGRLIMAMADGSPVGAAAPPPQITWSAA